MTVSRRDNPFPTLVDRVLASADPYRAAALHPWLVTVERTACEQHIFARRRYPRLFAQAVYTPASLLQRLAREDDPIILNKLAKNPATPALVLQRLARDCTDEARLSAISAHLQTGPALLDSLGRTESPARRQALCHNPNTGLAQLRRLLLGATLNDCKGMAKNPGCDAALLGDLWHRDERYLRAEIAVHANCPSDLLAIAVASDDLLLRRKAAYNPQLSIAQRTALLADDEASVRAAAVRHLGTGYLTTGSAPLLNDPARRVRREQARQNELDERLIKKLSTDEDSWVRRWIARNAATPTQLLQTLATDDEAEVRRGVARNPATPLPLRRQLAADPHPWVRAGIAYRDDLDADIITSLAMDKSPDVLAGLGRNAVTAAELLAQIAGHPDRDVRRAVILNQQAPLEVLLPLLEDPYPFNRVQLCRHPALSSIALWQLIDDPEPRVRFTAVTVLASRHGTGE